MSETFNYSISKAAKEAGISVHTLRMYEKEGLIIPHKKETNQRRYTESDIQRIRCIRKYLSVNKITIEGLRRHLAIYPCWAVTECTSEKKIQCEAYLTDTKPCWMHSEKSIVCKGKNCRECEVYSHLNFCGSIKDKIKNLI